MPITSIANTSADAAGTARFDIPLPSVLPFDEAWVQLAAPGTPVHLSAPLRLRLLDPDADEDGDGLLNGDEVDDGTDPNDPLDPPVDGCDAVQTVVDTHCTGCHGALAVDGLDLRDVSAVVGAVSAHTGQPLIVPGDEAGSYLMDKIRGTQSVGVQMPPGFVVDPADVQVVADWIDAGASCALPPPTPPEATYDPNTLDQEALFVCDGLPASSPGRLRRIDKTTLRRRVGLDDGHALDANPLEPPGTAPYSTYAEGSTMDVATVDLFLDMLPHVGTPWRGANPWDREAWWARDSSLSCIYAAGTPDVACIDTFARTYLTTAVVMGEPDPDEVDRLVVFARDTFAEETTLGTSRDDSLTTITSAAWLHTSALFERELGVGAPDAHGRLRLSDDEAASMVAGMLYDRGPGAVGIYLYDNALAGNDRWTARDEGHLPDLASAAADGTIQQPATIAALIRQYAVGYDNDRVDEWIDYGTHSLTGQRRDRAEEWMADRLDRFFLEWFDVHGFESGFQDRPNATTAWDADNPLHYQRSLDALRSYEGWNEPDGLMLFNDAVSRVVVEDTDVLRNLLTTRQFYLPATAGSTDHGDHIFGLDGDIAATRADRWRTLPADERIGLLTHPVWLAAHGDAFENGPSLVHRGKWVREHLFCETVPPLELVTVQAQLLPTDGTESARQRVEASIETQFQCMGCHQYMNDLGKPFEIYNHAGLLRVDDHGNAPDGSTVLLNAPDPALNRTYVDTMDFMDALASSDHVKRCFLRHTFRFFAGRDETTADTCVLADMEAAYDNSGGSFVSVLETLASHDALLYRTSEVSP
jgi:hypothetical protein